MGRRTNGPKMELESSALLNEKLCKAHLVVLQDRIQMVPPALPVNVHPQLLSHTFHLYVVQKEPHTLQPHHRMGFRQPD